MFTGIIEEVGIVKKIKKDKKNLILEMDVSFLDEIQINQSIAHNGTCLTVSKLSLNTYTVCAVSETIKRTTISSLKEGSAVNIERCLSVGERFDGHFVQGHVDCVAKCVEIINLDGSWIFCFQYSGKYRNYLVPKGSIAVNGVSLTISKINDSNNTFEVTIIPYSFNHTNFKQMKLYDFVNIEFDIISKQIARIHQIK